VLVSAIMIAQTVNNSWSELLSFMLAMSAERSASQNAVVKFPYM